MKRPRKWPHRARKDELVQIVLGEIKKRIKLDDISLNLHKLDASEMELLAMAFGYRDPEARAAAEQRAMWLRQQRERDEERRREAEAKRLPPPPKRITHDKEASNE